MMDYLPKGHEYWSPGIAEKWSTMTPQEVVDYVVSRGWMVAVLQSYTHQTVRQVIAGRRDITEEAWVAAAARRRLEI